MEELIHLARLFQRKATVVVAIQVRAGLIGFLMTLFGNTVSYGEDRLVFEPKIQQTNNSSSAKHIVLVAGDEEYRSEETMPMLAKLLSQKHGFRCTVLFPMGIDRADYINPNNVEGLNNLDALDIADLMLIGTRHRKPSESQAAHVTRFLNEGKPVIGIRTATHAFKGEGKFGSIAYDDFGLKILGETWVKHHGQHKRQGGRGVLEKANADHPILRGVQDVFTATDIYKVVNLTNLDTILMRGAVTESLDPQSQKVF